MIASYLANLRFRARIWLFVFALLLFGLAMPGSWPAGVPVGLGIAALLVRVVARQENLEPLPPSRLGAALCYAGATAFALPLLIVLPSIAQAVRRGNGLEETLLGVALGFFLYLVYRFIRWGRGLRVVPLPQAPVP